MGLEAADQPENPGQNQADRKAGEKREIEAAMLAPDHDVARQMTQAQPAGAVKGNAPAPKQAPQQGGMTQVPWMS